MRTVTITLCLCWAGVASGQGLFGWIDLENEIIVQPRESDLEAAGLDITSEGGYLIPIPPGGISAPADPFTFLLANNEGQITAGNLAGMSTIPHTGLSMDAGYDLPSALAAGIDPCDDLVVAYGDGPNTLEFPLGPPRPPEPPRPPSVFCTIPGDVDFDGSVTFTDFLTLSDNFGMTDAVWPDGDFDWDRTVGFTDFLFLSENFEQSLPATSVPEPRSECLAFVAFVALLSRRQRTD